MDRPALSLPLLQVDLRERVAALLLLLLQQQLLSLLLRLLLLLPMLVWVSVVAVGRACQRHVVASTARLPAIPRTLGTDRRFMTGAEPWMRGGARFKLLRWSLLCGGTTSSWVGPATAR